MTSSGYGRGILGFQFGSGDKKDTLFAIALVVIVVVAIGLTVWQTVLRPSGNAFVFECTKCGYQFNVPQDDKEVLSNAMGPMGVTKVCPKCDQKAALWANKCPSCGKNMLTKPDGTCPRCGVNVKQFVDEKVRKAMDARKSKG